MITRYWNTLPRPAPRPACAAVRRCTLRLRSDFQITLPPLFAHADVLTRALFALQWGYTQRVVDLAEICAQKWE